MFDIFIEKLKNVCKSRMLPVTIVYLLLVSALVYRLFHLQIVEGEKYETSFTETSTQQRVIQATRGNIYDVKGRLLAYNVLSYNVTFLDTGVYTDSETLNSKIFEIIRLIEKNGDQLDIDFNLKIDEKGNISFSGSDNEILRFKRDVFAHNNVNQLTEPEKKASAEEVFNYLWSSKKAGTLKFNIDSSKYTKQEIYKILTVRYAMYLNTYSKYKPIELATKVNDKTIAAVKEYSGDISGLDVQSTTTREYNKEYAYSMAQVLGYTGKISDEAFKELEDNKQAKGYSKDDQVGKTGVEQQFDKDLHGTNGTETVILSQSNRVLEVKPGKAAVAGKDVHLSIDAELQNVAYSKLEKEIKSIIMLKMNAGTATKNKDGNLIPAAAVYFALLDNATINISHLNAEDATDVEKAVYDTFVSERKKVFNELKTLLTYSKSNGYNSLSEQEKDYIDYIYKMLVRKNVLISANYKDLNDAKYTEYTENKISLGEFIKYALNQENWVDRTIFSDADKFYDSEEIYDELLKYIKDQLKDDTEFSKMIYKKLVYRGQIQAKQICLLLFDQNVLKYNQKDYTALKNGTATPYYFIRSKIDKLEITPGQLGLDPCSGSVVITDPNSGKVSAMVSYPGYDNNRLANKIDSDYYSTLTENDAYPLLNRPIQQKTAPGSTYKMISAIAGLEEHVVYLGQKVNCTGKFDTIKPAPYCWKHSGHGNLDVVSAIEVSCNVYFYNVGYQLGLQNGSFSSVLALKRLNKYAEQFGFGSKSGVELPNEAENQLSDTQGVHSAIGQGTNNFNPVNLAKYITGLSNGGTVYDLSILKDSKKVVSSKVEASSSTWNAVKEGTRRVVNSANSSYRSFYNVKELKDVVVAGKTGTAQENKNRPDHALFVSYAPYNNPEVTITTVIPNGYASSNAAKLTAEIYKYYFANEKDKKELKNKDVEAASNTGVTNEG